MSDVLPHLSLRADVRTERSYGGKVVSVDFGLGCVRPNIQLEDGRSGVGCCLGCSRPPCILRPVYPEAATQVLSEFPQDPSSDLCPTNCIDINQESKLATIDTSSCIGCGLCVARCPFGAIHLSTDGKAVVEYDDSDKLLRAAGPTPLPETVGRAGVLGAVTVASLANIPDVMRGLKDVQALRLVGNAFSLLGVDARVRRRGDTNVRFDGVVGFDGRKLGVMEIEITPNVVESPRALLEDVAVLHSRYNVRIEDIYPLSVILSLPNARSEYYQVMQDIENVLNIQCRTITIGALLTLVWHHGVIEHLDGLFLTTPGGVDMRDSICKFVGSLHGEPYPGAFITAK